MNNNPCCVEKDWGGGGGWMHGRIGMGGEYEEGKERAESVIVKAAGTKKN